MSLMSTGMMISTHPPSHGTTGTTWSHKKTLTTWTNACATTWTGPQTTWTTKRWRRWYKLANCTNWKVQVHTLYIQFFLGQAVKFAPKDEGFDFCEFKGKWVSIGHCTQCPNENDTSWWKFISGPDEDDDDEEEAAEEKTSVSIEEWIEVVSISNILLEDWGLRFLVFSISCLASLLLFSCSKWPS